MSSLFKMNGGIDHTVLLSDHLGRLHASAEYSDITIVVEGKRYAAHKIILASRSDYFRALLYGGLKETDQTEIELKSAKVHTFDVLLKYIYTGQVAFHNLMVRTAIDLLGMCHEFGFIELEIAMGDFLKDILQVRNVCAILNSSQLYQMQFLHKFCLEFIDTHARELIEHEAFSTLSPKAMCDILERDTFYAPEVDIFRAVHNWYIANPNENYQPIIKNIRLGLMSIEDLLEVVRPTGMITSEELLDAVQIITTSTKGLRYRGMLMSEINVACPHLGATVIQGDMPSALMDGNVDQYDMERGYTRHSITDCYDEGIVIRLGCQAMINYFQMLLWDKDLRSYSYYIEVSVNNKDWNRVIDHTHCSCRSWQYLHFPEQVVQYIRIVGTNNTVNKVFHVVSFQAKYSSTPETLVDGVIVPKNNVATIDQSATVVEGVSRSRNTLLNGNVTSYDWDVGYTCHQLGSGQILVQLGQPYMISSLRLLLWDLDSRTYCYYIETSTNGTNWEIAVDRRTKPSQSWQHYLFKARPVVFIKIVGTQNSANEVFHCVHLEAPARTFVKTECQEIVDELPDS